MLKYYSIDWQDVVRQCYETLRCSLEGRKPLIAHEQPEGEAPETGYFHQGRTDSMPHALLLDHRLTPLERNTWQILRWLVTEQQLTMPRYQDLQPYLATSPCGGQASRETIARALNVLRTTRWLSLVERARDEQGCLRGCSYLLHDHPLSPATAVERDAGYLGLIQQNLSHANQGVRNVARYALEEIQADPQVPCEVRMAAQQLTKPDAQCALPLKSTNTPDSERSESPLVRIGQSAYEESEPGLDAPDLAEVRNAVPSRTVQKDQSKKSTVPASAVDATTRWPDSLQLSPAEQRMAVQALRQLEPEQRQAVISEAVVRCARGDIRKPVAYLMGLVKRACQGEFTLWAGRTDPLPATNLSRRVSVPLQPAAERASRAKDRAASPLAQACLQELKRRCHVTTGT